LEGLVELNPFVLALQDTQALEALEVPQLIQSLMINHSFGVQVQAHFHLAHQLEEEASAL